MALTIAQFNALPNNTVGFHQIADTVTNLVSSPLYSVPIVGPILQSLVSGLVGNGQATITALVSGTGGLATLSPTNITDLAGIGTSLLDPGANSVVSTATALLMGGSNISFVDNVVMTATTTASQLNLLNPTEILNLGNSGVDLLDPVTDTVLPMATAILLGQNGVGFVDTVAMTVQTTIADLNTLSPTNITDLLSTGADLIDPLTGGSIPLDVAQLLGGGDMSFVDGVVMTVEATAAELTGMDPADILDLSNLGIDLLDPGADGVIDMATALLMGQGDLSFVDDVVMTVQTTAAEITGMDPSDFLDLSNLGIDLLDPGADGVIDMATALLMGQGDLGFVDDVVMTVQTTVSELSNLTPTDITDLLSTGTDLLDPVTGGTIPLDVAQLLAGGDLAFVDDVVMTVQGTLTTLTPSEITDLADLGVDLLSGGGIGDAVGLTVEQLTSIFDNGLSLDQLDVNVLLDTGTNIANMTLTTIYNLVTLLIDVIDVVDGTVFITVEQAKAFAQAGTEFEPTDTVVILDTGANIEALTLADIAAIASINVDEVNAISNQLSLSLAQISAFGNASISFATGDAITVADTGANIFALTGTQIADLGAAGIVAVDATNDALTLTFDKLQDFLDAGIALTSSDVVTLQGLASDFETLTTNEINSLVSAGVDFVNATDNTVSLTMAQAQAFASGGLAFAADDIVSVVDTGNNIAALTTNQIADLADAGVDFVDASDDTISLTAAQAKAFIANGIALAEADVVTLYDSGTNIANLTANEINALKDAGVDKVDAINNAVSLTIAQAVSFINAELVFAVDDIVSLVDTGVNIANLTAQNIADLANAGIDKVNATGNAVSLTVAQIEAFAQAEITFAVEDVITLADTGVNIANLTVGEIAGLVDAGVSLINATNDAVSLTLAQALAYVAAGLAFAEDDVVTLLDAGATIATLTTSQIEDLKELGVDIADATNDAINVTAQQVAAHIANGIAFAGADVVSLSDTGANFLALAAEDINDIKAIGVDTLDATNNAVSLSIAQAGGFAIAGLAFAANDVVTVVDTGANIAALAVLTIGALDGVGVDVIDLSNNAATLIAAQAKALVAAGITFAANDVVTLSDLGTGIATLTVSEIGQLAATGFDAIDVINNLASLSIAQLAAFSTAGIAFAENDVLKLADTGAHIAALSVDAIGALVAQGADSIDLTDNAVSLTVAQAKAFATSGLAFATGDIVTIADTGANVAALTTAQIADLKDTGLDLINLSDNLVSISSAQYSALGDIAFAAEDVVKVIGTDARDTITAHGGHTSLYGGKGVDTLTGGADHTILSGGKGKDRLFGGQGEDVFLFDAKASRSSVDRIQNFDAAEDLIALDHNMFKKIGATLERSEFHSGRSAHDNSDHLIYDAKHGALYYDKDGSGGHDAVKIAQFDHGVKLSISDFEII